MTNTPKAGEIQKMSFSSLLIAPHVLISGETGSGKSVLLNGVICCALGVKNARGILIDPKRIELNPYRRAKWCRAYGRTPAEAVRLLSFAVSSMYRIYAIMERKKQKFCPFSPVYVIIDELADLLLSPEAKQIKQLLQSLLQLGRAANIHVIAATQTPARRTLPAELVLNFTHRIGLRCATSIESRQIIGVDGAEDLPRYGLALVKSSEGLYLRSVPNCTEEDARRALAVAETRFFRAGIHPRK